MNTPAKLQRRIYRGVSEGSKAPPQHGNTVTFKDSVEEPDQFKDLDVQRLLAAYNSPAIDQNNNSDDDYPNVVVEGSGIHNALCGQSAMFQVTDSNPKTQSIRAYLTHTALKMKAECTSVCASPGIWQLSYVVTTAGQWNLFVYVCGSAGQQPVHSSPFVITVSANSISAHTSVLEGAGLLQARQREANVLSLTLVDQVSNRFSRERHFIHMIGGGWWKNISTEIQWLV